MRKVKKDILKCNFPTKVKFMGLSERKVMFLTENDTKSFENGASIDLRPTRCPNIASIANVKSWMNAQGQIERTAKFSNWDKMCILGIYIKMQPVKNQWTGAAGDQNVPADTINEVQCTYTFNNVPDGFYNEYDSSNVVNKQVFTFNSNESFTIYIPAPPTMCTDSPCIYKSKTWWSITDLNIPALAGQLNAELGDEEDEEEDDDMIGTPYGNLNAPVLHAGRLYLKSNGVARYNITINYKVALKG